MSSDPVVSVVIIFFNAEGFLGEAIESALAQTYDAWELLLVDDGSTDGSGRIARTYTARYPHRLRYLRHENGANRGMSASRNLGTSHARGRYVAFLDADDAWFPKTLEQQVATLEACPQAGMVYGPIEWWYSWAGSSDAGGQDYVEELGVPADSLIRPPTLVPLFLQNRAAVPSGMLVRREVIERVRGFEDAFCGEYEDQVFCAKVCLRFPIFASSRCWYRYRQHSRSAVAVGLQTGRTQVARARFLNWLTDYLIAQRIHDANVWRAVLGERLRLQQPRLYYLLKRGNRLLQRMTRDTVTPAETAR